MKHVFPISFEILGSHAQITEMKFTRAIGRTWVFLLTELPGMLQWYQSPSPRGSNLGL